MISAEAIEEGRYHDELSRRCLRACRARHHRSLSFILFMFMPHHVHHHHSCSPCTRSCSFCTHVQLRYDLANQDLDLSLFSLVPICSFKICSVLRKQFRRTAAGFAADDGGVRVSYAATARHEGAIGRLSFHANFDFA